MLSSKVISRTVHGHLLVDAAVNGILIAVLYKLPLPPDEKKEPSEP